ncbi:RNA polymerase-binding protein RbpA [Agromyces salentinus]|uniref:RNA polymerase-binding protein RbpA n=1 Tax=Agromyces salentinus TaxID=269421 RepID=A0ABN2MXV5_9MICO|nr:RNA polymerase-binding protein RbpA [Agromyces salentinus]
MADRSLRGMRIGAQSLQSEDGVIFAERAEYRYRCAACNHETVMIFSAEAETPEEWECRNCGAPATLLVDSKPVEIDRSGEKVARTHWDMLLERRTRAELEELLEERLAFLRARRGQKQSA